MTEVSQRECSVCGSRNTRCRVGRFPTGVIAPDGEEEWRESLYRECLDCQTKEEL